MAPPGPLDFRGNITSMNPRTGPRLAIVILCAGHSRRLGSPKALARVRGVGLLRRTARLLASFAAAGMAVIAPPKHRRHAVELAGFDVKIHVNRQRARGLSSSVRVAIAHAGGASAVLIVPVDLPGLERRDIARLIAAWHATPRRTVARRIGAGGGAPLILPRRFFPAARALEGDVGLRDWLRQLPAEQRRFVPMPSAAADVDTPQDLRAARGRRAQPPAK